MLFIALAMLLTGIAVSTLGFKMFKILLPILGLVAGAQVGFIGFQGVFGVGIVSTSVAIFVAMAVGVVMALLSFVFFEVAVTIYMALLGASALTYLGVSLGVGDNSFVMWILALTGLIIGLTVTKSQTFSARLIMSLTSFIGVALILSSVFLIFGQISVEQLYQQGVAASIVKTVDQSFLWLFVWLGGSMIAMQAQKNTFNLEILKNQYQFKSAK
ncbi:hypothetical protein KA529_02990 [Candidatus Saccharibacteria bacterium]|nr:hypothetical protein [Candidatus Saccharibacteria bacterium]